MVRPMIETERLRIRKFTEEDIDLVFDINNDPECIKFNGWDSMSLEKCRAELDKWIQRYKQSDVTGVYCVECRESKQKVGMAFIVDYKKPNQLEIGFRLRRMHWNQGYAKEIARGFIRYSQYNLNAHVLFAEVYRANSRSRNVFEKLGFETLEHPEGEEGLLYRYLINK